MPSPTIFLSAATEDLKEWRELLAKAFSRAGFRVIVQDQSLSAPLGDVRRLLADHIRESDCVIHLAGVGYGSHAVKPFPDFPEFMCSWTQFEYYYAHSLKKDVVAFVCAPSLSRPEFHEKGDIAEIALKTELQQKHCARVASGKFNDTPLAHGTSRTLNELVDSQAAMLTAVAAAVGSLHRTDPAYDRVKATLESMGDKLDKIGAGQNAARRVSMFILVLILIVLAVFATGGIVAYRSNSKSAAALSATAAETLGEVKKARPDLAALKVTFEKAIRAKADELIAAKIVAKATWHAIAEIEGQRDRQIAQLGDLVNSIGRNLGPTASPIYQEAIRVLENEGVAEVIRYLERQQPTMLADDEAMHRKKAEDEERFQVERENALQPILLQASMLTIQFRFDEALAVTETLAHTPTGKKWWSLYNLRGNLYVELARWSAAETEFRLAKKLAAGTSASATVMRNLSSFLIMTNRFAEAEPLMRRVLANDEANYGKDKPTVADDLDGLATVLVAADRRADAEPLLRRAIAIDEGYYGKDHPNLAYRLEKLGSSLMIVSRFSDAEPLLRHALSIQETVYGKDHPRTASALGNLGTLLAETNRLADAEPLLRRSLAIVEGIHTKDHPAVALELASLASLLLNTGRFADAEPLLRRALAIDEVSYGQDHPRIAQGQCLLAQSLMRTNRMADAEKLLRRSVLFYLRFERQNQRTHSKFTTTFVLFITSLTMRDQPVSESAQQLKTLGSEAGWEDAIWAIRLGKLSAVPPGLSMAAVATTRALSFHREGNFSEAARLWSQALDLNQQEPTINPIDTRRTRLNIAISRFMLGQTYPARDDLVTLIGEFEIDRNHSAVTASAYYHLAQCFVKLDQKSQAIAHLRKALAHYASLDPKEIPQGDVEATRQTLIGLEEKAP